MQMVMTSLFDKEVIGDLLDNKEGNNKDTVHQDQGNNNNNNEALSVGELLKVKAVVGDKEGILNNSMSHGMSMFDHNHGNVAGVDDDAVEHAVTMTTAKTKTKRDKKWLENYCELQVREESYSYIMLLLISPQHQHQSHHISHYHIKRGSNNRMDIVMCHDHTKQAST